MSFYLNFSSTFLPKPTWSGSSTYSLVCQPSPFPFSFVRQLYSSIFFYFSPMMKNSGFKVTVWSGNLSYLQKKLLQSIGCDPLATSQWRCAQRNNTIGKLRNTQTSCECGLPGTSKWKHIRRDRGKGASYKHPFPSTSTMLTDVKAVSCSPVSEPKKKEKNDKWHRV